MKSTLMPLTPHFSNWSSAGPIWWSSVFQTTHRIRPTFFCFAYAASASMSMPGVIDSRSPSLYQPSSRMMYSMPYSAAKSMKCL